MATKTQLINHNLSSLSGGVTEQFQEGRFDSQVSEMINCIPSITRGVLRRNPVKAVDTLVSPTQALPVDLSDCFIYSYDRGTGEEQYIVVIPGDGYVHTFNANDGSHLYTNTTINTYLQVSGTTAKKAFNALTIGDYTFVVNSTKTVGFTADTAPTIGYSDMAFYWIKKTTSVTVAQYQSSTEVGSLLKGYNYSLNDTTVPAHEETRPNKTGFSLNSSKEVAAKFASGDNSYVDGTDDESLPSGWTGAGYNTVSGVDISDGAVAYKTNYTGTDWKWSDTFGDQASLGVWKTVKDSDELPVNLPEDLDGFVVKVSGGTSAEYDDYYLKYTYTNRSWKEVAAPGSNIKLDPATMPHVLYRLSGGFEFNTYQGVITDGSALDGESQWGERTSGGDDSIEDPSFVGTSITNIFFHKNRLGFITDDSIILSMTGIYGNFFIQTLQETLDDDPIDLSVASTDVTILRHAVPTAGQLLLFSDDTQFSLESLEGALTPDSADITALSSYTYGKDAKATAIGNRVFFTNQVNGYNGNEAGSSQVYAYTVSDRGSQITEANPMTLHLPTYLSYQITKIVGHDVLGFTFFEEEQNPKQLTVLSSVIRGKEELQNSFHRWTFEEDIASTQVINNELYILFTTGNLTKMSLAIPNSISNITYTDEYTTGNYTNYESLIEFSEFFIRDNKGKGTVRGRYQLRTIKYTIDEASSYVTLISDKNNSFFDESTMYGTDWDDTDTWDDTLLWVETNPEYSREYKDDELVTIMAESKRVTIQFKSSEDNPTKGFELATANIEGLFHQRSLRR